MRHSLAWKALALILCACALTAAVGGGFCVAIMASSSMYSQSLEEKQQQWMYDIGSQIASDFAYDYAAQHLGGCGTDMANWLNPGYSNPQKDNQLWHVALIDGDRVVSEAGQKSGDSYAISYNLSVHYPEISEEKPADYDQQITTMVDGVNTTIYVTYKESPLLNPTVSMNPQILSRQYLLLTNMHAYRYHFLGLGLIGLVLFGLLLGALCWSAGVGKNGIVKPGGMNRLPLDLHLGITAAGVWGIVVLLELLYQWIISGGHPALLATAMAAVTFVGALGCTGFLFGLAAQLRSHSGKFWRHTAIGFGLRKLWQGLKFVCRGIRAVFLLLPVIWQWLVAFGVLGTVTVGLFLLLAYGSGVKAVWLTLLILFLLGDVAAVLYGGYCMGRLMSGAERMASGDLSYQIPTRYLAGSFRAFAQQLNSLSETAMIAAQKQTRSERMKTELITNVSHDIKTPLTSIINFVDLLQKPHTPQQEQEYLEILSRQSGRMKKLIEDLMELSKATTGNLTVNLSRVDAGEAVHQALGEFSDKLAAADITPVYHQPGEKVLIHADGRLMWRVLSNLLSNAVKYAMPGTRLYIDLARVDSQVMLSVKNVSREELRVSAEELMERFVRGDTSRNAEGSGLGLNIAKSLMEVQGGHLQLLVDGDLFKVTLLFPAI